MNQILYSNGVGVPHIKIIRAAVDSPGAPLLDIDLPFCQVRGHKESWEEISVLQQTSNFSITSPTLDELKTIVGFKASWQLDWSGLPLTVTDQQNIAEIYNSQKDSIIYFTPRTDYTGEDGIFEVIVSSINLDIIRVPGGHPHGNEGFIIEFKTKNLMPRINIRRVPEPHEFIPVVVSNYGIIELGN